MWIEFWRIGIQIGRVPQYSSNPRGIWVGYRSKGYEPPGRFAPRFNHEWAKVSYLGVELSH